MNNFGRAVLAVGLSAVMTFTNPGCFFQSGVLSTTVQAAEEGTTAEEQTGNAGSGESESTTQVTTEKKEETTTATESKESQTTSAEKDTDSSDDTTSSQSESTVESTQQNRSETTSQRTVETSTTEEQTDSNGTTAQNHDSQSRSTESDNTEDNSTKSNKKKVEHTGVSSRKDAEIRSKTVKDIKNELAEEAAPDGSDKAGTFIPKIYNDTRLAMKNNKEYIAGYVYFNQTDSAWNQNGYCIARAGCGPTSMAVVITSLTGKWVTPLDTAIWGYQHGFYSRAGSAHEMIPAMAAAYGLKCQGVGTDYNAIKKALKSGKPVVCLMGPGYFTRGGHFMVLVAIDKNDCVTVADVGSRTRSAYKYRLSDVIAQSKGASAGGPFWIMSYDKESRAALRKKQAIKNYTQEDMAADFADVSYMKVKGDLPSTLKEEKKEVSVKKVVSILKMSTGNSAFSTLGLGKESAITGAGSTASAVLSPVSQNNQVIIVNEATDGEGTQSYNNEGSAQSSAGMGDSTRKQSQNLALTLKQDIAQRQWEKRIPLSKLESYLKGTIER